MVPMDHDYGPTSCQAIFLQSKALLVMKLFQKAIENNLNWH